MRVSRTFLGYDCFLSSMDFLTYSLISLSLVTSDHVPFLNACFRDFLYPHRFPN